MPGKNPASAIPSSARAAMNDQTSVTNMVAIDTSPHPIRIRAIQRRAPTRSRSRLLGISNRQ